MALETDVDRSGHFHARSDERQFRWVYAVIFSIALIPAVCARLMSWRHAARVGETHKSIVDEARARTSRIVPFFFMG
jgi:hypothetical protein